MPNLLDIATLTVGKTRVASTRQGLAEYAGKLCNSNIADKQGLTLKNRLKTKVNVGSESNLGKIIIPPENDGIFASWFNSLNKTANSRFETNTPLNIVKDNSENEIKALNIELKRREWLEEVDSRMKKLNYKA